MTINIWHTVAQLISGNDRAVVLTIIAVKGSAPRNVGTQMVLSSTGEQFGTIGGGELEWQATKQAQQLLNEKHGPRQLQADYILGPDLGQCCGGHVTVSFAIFDKADLAQINQNAKSSAQQNLRQSLYLFGAGHVGSAMVTALAPLAFDIKWFDRRKDIFPKSKLENVEYRSHEASTNCFENVPENTFVLVMTHNHQLDFDLTLQALQQREVVFTGLIGSATKRARFCKRFAESGLALKTIEKLTCPIGLEGVYDKSPPAIAASVVGQLLQQIDLLKTGKKPVHLVKNSA